MADANRNKICLDVFNIVITLFLECELSEKMENDL